MAEVQFSRHSDHSQPRKSARRLVRTSCPFRYTRSFGIVYSLKCKKMEGPYNFPHLPLFLCTSWGAKRVGKFIRVFDPVVQSRFLDSKWLSGAHPLALTYTRTHASKTALVSKLFSAWVLPLRDLYFTISSTDRII